MRTSNKNKVELSLLFVCLLVVQACLSPAEGTVATNNDPVSEEPVTTTDSTSDLAGPAYLEATVAPCVPN